MKKSVGSGEPSIRSSGEPLVSQGARLLGQRDDPTCQQRFDKVGSEGRIFLTDDWDGYHRCISEAQLFTGKGSTFGIAQDNRNIRHYLARFCCRSKVSSRSREMVDLSLRLLHRLTEPVTFLQSQKIPLSIFS